MKKLGNLLKWLLAGIVFLGLGAAAYVFESDGGYGFSLNRYRLTSSCLILGVFCVAAAVILPFIKEPFVPGYLFVEDIFRMKPEGCVVVGYVKGRLRVNEPVTIRFRVDTIYRDRYVSLYLDGERLIHRRRRVLAPGEMEQLTLRPEQLAAHPEPAELTVCLEVE